MITPREAESIMKSVAAAYPFMVDISAGESITRLVDIGRTIIGEIDERFGELLHTVRFPFGKHEGDPLHAIPVSYLRYHWGRLDEGPCKWAIKEFLTHPAVVTAWAPNSAADHSFDGILQFWMDVDREVT